MYNSEVADPQEVPKNIKNFGHSMPAVRATDAQHLVVPKCPLNGLRQTTLCAFSPDSGYQSFLLFLVCIDILYILE